MSRSMFKKAYKTGVKSTFSMSYAFMYALACCHASVFAEQGPSGSDFGISSTWSWSQVITKFSQHSEVVLLTHGCGTRRAQPLAELSLSERSEDSAVNRALRARIRRKLEAVKQEATQLPRLSSLRRRESVLCTYGIDYMIT